MDLGQLVVIGLSILLLLWFLAGIAINRKRARESLYWLRSGLEPLGVVGPTRWLGSLGSAVQVSIKDAVAPFRQVEVFLSLEPRENMPLWIFNRLRGKRDELVLRGILRVAPCQELEIARLGDQAYETFIAGQAAGSVEQLSTAGFDLALRGQAGSQLVECLEPFLNGYRDSIQRMSLRRISPHLLLRANLASLRVHSAADFFRALQEWLSEVHRVE